jgi:ATP-dependent DNA helicase HFM1/MER3
LLSYLLLTTEYLPSFPSVDEVHTVGSDVRGAVLEVVVSRMKTLGTSTRFIAVSATVPNIEDVAEWLGSGGAERGEEKKSAEVFRFGEEFRPCKLQKCVSFPHFLSS